MIDSNLIVEYLEPALWGRLGTIMEILNPARKVLHILEEQDGCRAYFCGEMFYGENAEEQFSDADEVRIYTHETICAFYKAVQDRKIYEMDIDVYLHTMYEELAARIPVVCRKKKREKLWKILKAFGKSDGVYNIGIMQEENLFFQCMLEFRAGKLVRITSADRYGQDVSDWEKICENADREFSGECVHIMMTLEELRERYSS